MAFDPNEPAYQRARARRTKLLQELEAVDLFLAMYQQFASDDTDEATEATGSSSADVQKKDTALKLGAGSEGAPDHSVSAPISQREKLPRGMSQADTEEFVREILVANGRPMSAADLLQRIHERGRIVGGHDEASNLKTKLWRAKGRINVIPGAGYWPQDVDCEAVGYRTPIARKEITKPL